MEIPLNAEVRCVEGVAGHSTHIILNPITLKVTHFVVRSDALLEDTDHLVPVDRIIEAKPGLIRVRCTQEELNRMPVFTEVQFLPYYPESPTVMMWPYVEALQPVPIGRERVPPGELSVRRGDHVDATDGRVGKVDELMIDPANDRITHLVLREGHLWDRRDVTIPVSQIDHIEEGTIYLSTNKSTIEALPAIPIRRRRGEDVHSG